MRVTLDDVAQASRVSKATASYVLNNKKSSFGLSPVTIERVLRESRRLNYRPDRVAQALAEQKRAPLGVLILSPWLHCQFSDFMVQVSHAVEAVSAEMKVHADYKLYKIGELKRTLKPMKCGKYDAVIVLGTGIVDDLFLEKNRGGFPNLVLLNRSREGYASSYGNDEESCEELAKRVISGGYYEKYVLSVNGTASHRELLRIGMYRRLLSKSGIEFRENPCDPGMPEDEYPETLLDAWGTDRVCYFFTQYYPAASLVNFAVRSGIDVPHGIGIVGYDQHSLLKNFLNPPLTTIDPRVFEMTKRAFVLAQMLREGRVAADAVTDAVIVEGGSAVLGK